MARLHSWLVVSFLSFSAVGCVTQEKYNALKMESDQYAVRLSAVEREKAEAIAARDLLKQQLDRFGMSTDQKDALVLNQASQISALTSQIAELNQKLAKALSEVGTSVVLPPELNRALREFAAANPDLVDFDENRGVVKFKSDVTFAPGSAVLTPTASSAIDRFAAILNSPTATGYELMVVGHTDNVRVAHEATVRAGHKDNWYLSAHRAISVSAELQRQAVNPARLEVAGCADQRPIASNATESGKAMNRRVEVLIMPTTVHGPLVSAAPAPMAAPVHASAKVKAPAVLNKDANKDAIDGDPKKAAFNK